MDNGKSKRQKILEASMKIFFRDGFHKAKVSEIAKEASIGKGTVYEYFDSKKQLFEEMIRHYADTHYEKLMQALQQKQNPIDKLKGYISFEKENACRHGDFAYLFERRGQAIDKEVRKIMLAARDKIICLIENIIREGMQEGIFRDTDPYVVALMFLGGISQVIFDQMIIKDKLQKSLSEENLLNILLNGIQKE